MEIDLDQLMLAFSTALKTLQDTKLKAGESVRVELDKPEEKTIYTVKEKKKRGRPKKEKPTQPVTIEVGDLKENLDEVLNYKPPEVKRGDKDFIAVAKRAVGAMGVLKSTDQTQSVLNPNRKMRFMDDRSVPPDKGTYPEPEPTSRQSQQKVKFNCCICHRDFEAYWSERPQALLSMKDPAGGVYTDERPLVKCDGCEGSATR